MKALTIHQPFAEYIVRGQKPVEFRSWSTNYRGPLAIHAAAGSNLPRGGFVGVVELYDCRPNGEQYLWMLRNPRRIAFIPCSGQQGLWTPPQAVLDVVEK